MCKVRGIERPITEFPFYRRGPGRRYQCLDCRRAYEKRLKRGEIPKRQPADVGDTIPCSACEEPFIKWSPKSRKCRSCMAAYQRQMTRKHREKYKIYYAERHKQRRQDDAWISAARKRNRDRWATLRDAAIRVYGGYRCACCGETEPTFLTLDHVFNDGSAHRKEIGGRGAQIFKWLRDHGYPAGFQVLCFNCNLGKSLNGGICPHESARVSKSLIKTRED